MNVLGIETSTTVCAAAVAAFGSVVAEESLEEKYVHAEKLLTLIDRALTRSGVSLEGLDGVAVSAGPGSFTGLRIGLSVAKGLVYAHGTPLVAVPTLEALARRALSVGGSDIQDYILTILDARRNDVYWQLFAREGQRLRPIDDVMDSTLSEVVRKVGTRSVLVTGDACPKLKEYLRSLDGHTRLQFHLLDAPRARCSAGSVAVLGTELLGANNVQDPATLEPRYIKEFFLTTHHHDKGT